MAEYFGRAAILLFGGVTGILLMMLTMLSLPPLGLTLTTTSRWLSPELIPELSIFFCLLTGAFTAALVGTVRSGMQAALLARGIAAVVGIPFRIFIASESLLNLYARENRPFNSIGGIVARDTLYNLAAQIMLLALCAGAGALGGLIGRRFARVTQSARLVV